MMTAHACGGSEEPRRPAGKKDLEQKAAPNGDETGSEADKADPPRVYTKEELIHLAGSRTDAKAAYEHCRDVLAQGIYNRSSDSLSSSAVFALKQEYCQLQEGEFIDKVAKYLEQRDSSSSGRAGSGQLGLDYMTKLGLDISASQSRTDARTSEEIKAEASEAVRKWRSQNCGSRDEDSKNTFVHTVLSENIDKDVIAAWQSCVAKENNGFFCASKETDGLINISVRWLPNDIQKKLLPIVKLEVTGQFNTKMVTATAPTSLGTDSEKIFAFRKEDPNLASVVNFQAADKGDQVSFACSLVVPKLVKAEMKESDVCGVAFYNTGRGKECGVELYNERADTACGVREYNEARSPACGVELYNAKADLSCAGSLAAHQQTVETFAPAKGFDAADPSCPTDYQAAEGIRRFYEDNDSRFGPRRYIAKKTLLCARPEKLETCRRPEFGVEQHNLCRSSSHGVAAYNACRLPAFGVQTYHECRNPAFGVGKYNSCLVRVN
jgi:hypothetical protein